MIRVSFYKVFQYVLTLYVREGSQEKSPFRKRKKTLPPSLVETLIVICLFFNTRFTIPGFFRVFFLEPCMCTYSMIIKYFKNNI